MASTGSGSLQPKEHEAGWTSTIACLIVGAAFFSLWFWLLPGWFGFQTRAARNDPWRWIAAVPSVLGFAVALRCVWDFGQIGHGTPSPIAPPKKLVVVGFCRYIRNPMYMGFFLRVAWIMGGVRMVELGGDWHGRAGDFGSHGICAAVRRAEPAEIVWR
jgi:protein-S-isoprenylcysteine O-methyltransferase Ste14